MQERMRVLSCLMPSVKSVDEAKTMRKQITELGDKAGFMFESGFHIDLK